MTMWRATRFVVSFGLLTPSAAAAQSSAPVELVVRVFDALEEVTADCQIALYAADTREAPLVPDLRPGTGHYISVEPGLYDLQITRHDPADTAAIAWADHLSVLRYPDNGGTHVEVINLQPAFGALVVRPPAVWLDTDREWSVSAFLHGGVGRAGFESAGGTHHQLFILPAGHYDLVASLGSTELTATDVEVPAQRTRLKLLELQ